MSTFVWLEHPPTGDKWQCPGDAADAWRALGWSDCDPPGEEPEPEVAEPIADEASPSKTADRKRGGETTTAPEE